MTLLTTCCSFLFALFGVIDMYPRHPSAWRNAVAVEDTDINSLNYSRNVGYPLVGENYEAATDELATYIGQMPTDPPANHVFNEAASLARMHFLDDYICDSIIKMPPGYRTRADMNGIAWMPIGLFVYRLRKRALAIHGNDRVIGSLVLDGTVFRFQNKVVSVVTAEWPPGGQPGETVQITSNRVFQDVYQYEFHQFPLDRVIFDWPGDTWEDADFDWGSVATYFEWMTRFDGHGSDMQMYIMTANSTIYKRYASIREIGYDTPYTKAYKTRLMRTAGLRQVVLENLDFTLTDEEDLLLGKRNFNVFYPCGGDGNCFEACVRYCYVRLESEAGRSDSGTEEVFYRIWRRIFEELYPKAKSVDDILDLKRKGGLTSADMKNVARILYLITGYRMECWYRKGKGEWVDICDMKLQDETKDNRRICLFQCYDNGYIRDQTNKDVEEAREDDDKSLGVMLHCVTIYPAPNQFLRCSTNPKKVGRLRLNIVARVNEHTVPFMKEMKSHMQHWEGITEADIQKLVAIQKERRKEVNTGIFTSNSSMKKKARLFEEEDGSMKKWQAKAFADNAMTPELYVFAYDLETVRNDAYLNSRIWSPYRHDDNPNPDLYHPPESEVPYMAQWVCVNFSDRGVYLQRKLDDAMKYPEAPSTITTYTPEPESENPDIFLSPPHVETGDMIFGKCIEDMLVNIAGYIHSRGGKTGYMYAHNGSKFDVYVLLQFQRFTVSNILKTSRGIISCTIRVPIVPYDIAKDDDSVPLISLHFRDTILIFNASLSRLCKSFNVPINLSKIDFPIGMVNAENCYHPSLFPLIYEYGLNDVRALGYIMVKMNDVIGEDVQWKPATTRSIKPPLVQFNTLMSMIKKATRIHFTKTMGIPRHMLPCAIDIPALRNWLQKATIGGRVNAYAKTYVSPLAGQIMAAYIRDDKETLCSLYKTMEAGNLCMQVLDFTSLYPFAMDSCPMPLGSLYSLPKDECLRSIDRIHCDTCDSLMSLCPKHRLYYNRKAEEGEEGEDMRPFTIIIVKNVHVKEENRYKLRNMCGRKTFNSNTHSDHGLNYSLETGEEFLARKSGLTTMHETQSYSNVDLYWMRRCGYSFEIIGGFGFGVSNLYNTFIGPAFLQRIEAKKAKNTVLSEFLKLKYNGSFGITAQRDIKDAYFVVKIPEELKLVDPRESIVRKHILEKTTGHMKGAQLLATEELTGEASFLPGGQAIYQKRQKEDLAEYYDSLSPMQIGAAVLSWSRHIANLVMCNNPETSQIYTDTDSICVDNRLTKHPSPIAKLICNRDDAPLGTLKNDHADDGKEPRIFMGMIGTKKVKCYFTLTEDGKVTIHNTFKGLHVAKDDVGGVLRNIMYGERISCETLFSLNLHYRSDPVEATSWTRSLGSSITIRRIFQQFHQSTYLENCKGTTVIRLPYGSVEFFIPHGCYITPDFKDTQHRYENLENSIYKDIGQNAENTIREFINKYYQYSNVPYNPGTEEWKNIMGAFEKANSEIL